MDGSVHGYGMSTLAKSLPFTVTSYLIDILGIKLFPVTKQYEVKVIIKD